MSRTENILAGIALLDPSNDDHWTSGGLARVEIVTALSKEESAVSRSEITDLAPDLSRETAPELGADDSDETSLEPPAEQSEETEPLTEADALKAELLAEVEACKQGIAENIGIRDKAAADIRALELTQGILETRYAALFPPVPAALSVQAYQKKSAEQRRARVERARNSQGAAKSNLDRAMARRGGFGQQRPEGFLLGKG